LFAEIHEKRRSMNHPEMRSTVFGEVLASLLEAREIPGTPFTVGKLAEDAGLDGRAVINRMAATAVGNSAGYLDGLADALDLSEPEKMRLALAYSLEERRNDHPDDPPASALSEVNGYLSHALDRLESVPAEAFENPEERFRLQELIAKAGQIVAAEESARA
jgi:hypothetical protein